MAALTDVITCIQLVQSIWDFANELKDNYQGKEPSENALERNISIKIQNVRSLLRGYLIYMGLLRG